jgi:hypothetical protein
MVDFFKVGRVLSTKGRKQIKESNFALSGRRYPIYDLIHARSALSRVSQHGTSEEKAKVRAAVHSKYPGIEQGLTKSSAISTEKLVTYFKKLSPDEKAVAIAGFLAPIPGGSVLLPSAWKSAKSVNKHGLPKSSRRRLSKAIEELEREVPTKTPGISRTSLSSMRDEFDKIAVSKIAADYTNKVVSGSGLSDVSKSIGKVFSGGSGSSPPKGAGNQLPTLSGAGPGSTKLPPPQKATASASAKSTKPSTSKSPKNPAGAMKPLVAPSAPGAASAKPLSSITGGGMPYIAQPLAGVPAMQSMPVPPPPLPIIR